MTLTAFQERKLGRLFDTMDVNGDGHIGRTDYVRRVNALAQVRGWHGTSASYERHMRTALEEWRAVCQGADIDENARVSREEFLGYLASCLDDGEAIRAFARGDVQLMFDAMDADADDRITVDEYRVYLEACGLEASAADAFFAHADLDKDGRITRAEIADAFEEYLSSDDPSGAGNLLFGRIE